MSAAQLAALSAAVCAQLAAQRTTFFAGAACAGLTSQCMLAMPSYGGLSAPCVAQQQSLIAVQSSDAQLDSLSAAGWQGMSNVTLWIDLLTKRQAVNENHIVIFFFKKKR